jgi:hypothetical protein
LAAVSGPQPVKARRDGARSATRPVDLALEIVDRHGQRPDLGDQLASDPADDPRGGREVALETGQDDGPVEAADRRLRARVELVEVPSEAVFGARPLGDEILAMVDEEPNVAIGSIERRDRQVLPEGRPGDGQGIDRIALAGLPAGTAGTGHQLRRNPDDALAGDEQITRQTSAEVATVLQRPRPVLEAGGPADELEVPRARRPEGLLGQLPAGPVDGHRGMAALVRIDPDDDHLLVAS